MNIDIEKHKNIINELYNSENAVQHLHELKEYGVKYLTSQTDKIIDNEVKELNKTIIGLKQLNPKQSEGNLGIIGFKQKIKRLKYIKQLLKNENDKFINSLNEVKQSILNNNMQTKVNYIDLPLFDFLDEITGENENIELSKSDVYLYTKKVTDNFKIELTKIIFKDVEVYYNMFFKERIENECLKIYTANNWEIPKYKKLPTKKINIDSDYTFYDYDKMLNKTHPFDSVEIDYLIKLLKEKLKENKTSTNPINEKKELDNSINELKEKTHLKDFRLDIFKSKKEYNLFVHLNELLLKDKSNINNVKYTAIYWALRENKSIHETINQSMFKDFIKKEKNINVRLYGRYEKPEINIHKCKELIGIFKANHT